MSETKTITINVFRDPNGKPTCALDYPNGDFCQFIANKRFGSVDVCLLTGREVERFPVGFGFIRPANCCPLWRDEA